MASVRRDEHWSDQRLSLRRSRAKTIEHSVFWSIFRKKTRATVIDLNALACRNSQTKVLEGTWWIRAKSLKTRHSGRQKDLKAQTSLPSSLFLPKYVSFFEDTILIL